MDGYVRNRVGPPQHDVHNTKHTHKIVQSVVRSNNIKTRRQDQRNVYTWPGTSTQSSVPVCCFSMRALQPLCPITQPMMDVGKWATARYRPPFDIETTTKKTGGNVHVKSSPTQHQTHSCMFSATPSMKRLGVRRKNMSDLKQQWIMSRRAATWKASCKKMTHTKNSGNNTPSGSGLLTHYYHSGVTCSDVLHVKGSSVVCCCCCCCMRDPIMERF